jgi:hypothetical protein
VAQLDSKDIRHWLGQIEVAPLPAGDPRYVEFFESGTTGVDLIGTSIKFAATGAGSVNLFSGPRGSGKTTELLRLQSDLQEYGFTVFVVDILEYVNPSSPIDVTQFLVAFGLAFAEECAKINPALVEGDNGFSARFGRWLKRVNVKLDIGGVKVEASKDGGSVEFAGQTLAIDLKRELKGSEAFVDQLRNQLSFHLGDLRTEVAEFCEELSKKVSENPVVFVFDSMEKFRGTTQNDAEVQAAVEALFVHHTDKLVFPRMHVIYTVPPFLRIRNPAFAMHIGGGAVRVVASPKVRDRAGNPVDSETLDKFRTMLNLRVPMEKLFANPADVDRLIMISGGNLRDLLRLTRESITIAAARRLDAPVGEVVATQAIQSLRNEYVFTTEDRDFLRKIQKTRDLTEVGDDEIQRFAKLLDTEIILGHLNGSEWFEVHPLALDAIQGPTGQ